MPNRKTIHITQNDDGTWKGKREGAERSSVTGDTQSSATESSREIARREGGEVIIHGRDGKIRARETYGHDPDPPKDKEH